MSTVPNRELISYNSEGATMGTKNSFLSGFLFKFRRKKPPLLARLRTRIFEWANFESLMRELQKIHHPFESGCKATAPL